MAVHGSCHRDSRPTRGRKLHLRWLNTQCKVSRTRRCSGWRADCESECRRLVSAFLPRRMLGRHCTRPVRRVGLYSVRERVFIRRAGTGCVECGTLGPSRCPTVGCTSRWMQVHQGTGTTVCRQRLQGLSLVSRVQDGCSGELAASELATCCYENSNHWLHVRRPQGSRTRIYPCRLQP